MVKIYSNLQYNSPCNKTLSFCLCLALMEKTSILLLIFFFGVDDVQKRKKTKGKWDICWVSLWEGHWLCYYTGISHTTGMVRSWLHPCVRYVLSLVFFSCLVFYISQSFLSRSFWRVLNAIYDPVDLWLYFVQTFLNSFVLLHYEWHISYLH